MLSALLNFAPNQEMPMKRTFWVILAILTGIYLLVCAAIYCFQRRIIFLPGRATDPPPADLNITEVYFPTTDDFRLHGWWMPIDSSEYTLLFFHGNAGCVSQLEERMRFFKELGYSTLMIDYRGYGKSSGTIIEENDIYEDARAALTFVTDSLKVPMDKLIVWGWSLGGGVTTDVCENIKPAAVVLEGTFYSMDDIASHAYPLFPVKLLLNFHFRSGEKVKQFQSPVFCIHSLNDHTIPYEQGRKLFDAVPTTKEFLEIDGSHNHGYYDYRLKIINALHAFMAKHS
jgi:pimeloyl-ACP methyl ester carboxylesterase